LSNVTGPPGEGVTVPLKDAPTGSSRTLTVTGPDVITGPACAATHGFAATTNALAVRIADQRVITRVSVLGQVVPDEMARHANVLERSTRQSKEGNAAANGRSRRRAARGALRQRDIITKKVSVKGILFYPEKGH
jgi:hypothetical protein